MKICEMKNGIALENVKDFELPHIFECGQCFRWNKEEDGSYTGVAFGKVINLKKEGNNVFIDNTYYDEFIDIWYDYFDLKRDYGIIKKQLANLDETMAASVKFGHGIRILKQDEWETLISFIISANNRIPMIKKAIEALSINYGDYIGEYRGSKYYSFPKPEALYNLDVGNIQFSGIGFRGKYIISAAKLVTQGEIDIYGLKNLSTEEARIKLMKFPGVGPKVSDCIMFFSMDKDDAFPIDIWVKRVMEYFYVPEGTSLKKIQGFAQSKFGNIAGFAQQYLFYYARELKIGRKKR
ncbi:DNA-3-methyladenine glycosylase family protein [Paramaledivibacter caminithermalis]|jgi:N-glycosylase/DNA lyase|uniref:DNA-(apurinic or apyrimidinic site) lyase n=1 Tax=Paramaledivibacter caminithermalis (strain DSM 15212 / CIP 107654 / DViRD3) TaxID=1121301 RepID=A0A1M6Q873_PARC5|nr:DNA glycosylase [Paramaledivibacter caminithermalis]SHK16283.1 N-glycosylase/DNA lyase [Paramaledivibacter caminithermalis DSM 15212]